MPSLLHAPDALTQRHTGDVRAALLTGRVFVLQVAHPAVGAGVAQHSSFRTDPWQRARATLAAGERFLYHGEAAARAEGERLRALHRDIAGVQPDGQRYHALEPRAYGWVNAVFLDTTLAMHALYGAPLARAVEVRLFDEWREGSRLFGLRDRDLPASLDAYRAWFAEQVDTVLEYNEVVAELLRPDAVPPPPEWASALPLPAWRALWRPVAAANRWLTLASLPPTYRARLAAHHRWTAADQRRWEPFAAAVRVTVPRLPARLRYTPDAYRWLRAQRAAGPARSSPRTSASRATPTAATAA